MDILNTLFNSDGTIVDSIVIGSAKTIASSTKVTAPGTYVLSSIAKADGYPEDFTGKCLLVVSGTTQPMATTHVLFANSKLWSRASASDEWSRADSAFSEEELTQLAKVSAVVNSVVDSDNKVKTTALPDAVLHNKGAYASLSEMPTENVVAGDYCINTSTDTVYVYDADTNAWTDKLSDKVADLADSTTIYLNASTGDDTLDYGRGLSEDKPFKTLAAAWSYGLNKFYRNNTMLTFKFKAGNYGGSDEYYTFRAQRNITWEGDSDDPNGVVISCSCIGLEQSYNIHFTNVSFKFYGCVGGSPFRVMYGSYVRCNGHLGFQVMSENTDALHVVSVSNSATLDVGYPSEQYEWDITCGKAGLNVFDVSTNSGLQLDGIKLAINGQAPAKIFALSQNCNGNINWLTFTMNAVPVQIAAVSKNSQLLLSASGVTCTSTPVTVDDSSTYTGSAKSPNYNAAIRVNDVTNWESTAQMHNNIYRGANLLDGHFSSIADIMAAVRAGNFADIYVGDYFSASYTVDGTKTSSNFQIAGINLLQARRGYNEGKYDLCIIPQSVLGTSYMNSTNTTAGGYVGSYMYTTTLPKYYKALAGSSGTPFYGYIKTVSEYLSNTVDTAAAARGCSTWKGTTTGSATISACNLVLMSNTEVFGNIGWSSSQKGDEETFSMQLPIFRINPKAITAYWGGWWLRSVAGSTLFCFVGAAVRTSCNGASGVVGVRPRFFIS